MAQALVDYVLDLLAAFPAWFKVVVLTMLPITEYQLAIPVAIQQFGFNPLKAYLLALIGSILLFLPLYFGLDKLRSLVVIFLPVLTKPLDMFIARSERKLRDNYAKYGAVALFLFLVIPFPFTGIWTATTAAVVLKIPPKEAAAGIFLGVIGGQAVVTVVTTFLRLFIA